MKAKYFSRTFSRTLFLVSIAVVFGIAFSGCDRDEEPDGPNLNDRFGPFAQITALASNNSSVDFSTGATMSFTAEFNKNVPWILTITGQETGAKRNFEGNTKDVEVTWNGNTSVLPFFRAEPCVAVLTVAEQPDFIDSLSIEVLGGRNYPGYKLTGFETPAGSNIFFGNFEFEFTPNTGRTNSIIPAEGEFSYLLEGTDGNNPNFFVGLIGISPQVAGTPYLTFPTNVPSNLYFNCFLYNDGRPFGIAVIQFAYDTNNNQIFDDGTDETFQLAGDYPLDFTGWKKFSNTMADIGIPESKMDKIVNVRVLLISQMNLQPTPPLQVQFAIDYLIFTQGAPLAI